MIGSHSQTVTASTQPTFTPLHQTLPLSRNSHLSRHILNHHTQARDTPVGDEAAVDDASEKRHVNIAASGDDANLRV
jgi:hypothetical protein